MNFGRLIVCVPFLTSPINFTVTFFKDYSFKLYETSKEVFPLFVDMQAGIQIFKLLSKG
jgi:hypothetical protein